MAVPDGWIDTVTLNRNRELFPEEGVAEILGPCHVAWNLDGTRILADGRPTTSYSPGLTSWASKSARPWATSSTIRI